jgi:hypothetical protein
MGLQDKKWQPDGDKIRLLLYLSEDYTSSSLGAVALIFLKYRFEQRAVNKQSQLKNSKDMIINKHLLSK